MSPVPLMDASRVFVVVMDADDVGLGALPSVVANNRARGIERLRQMVERLDKVLLRRVSGRSGTPQLSLNGTQVTTQGWLTSRAARRSTLGRDDRCSQGEAIGAGHLLPDQQSQAIGPVEVAGILDLLVLANAIETHRLGQLHVAAQSVPIRRRHAAVGPVPLIENQAQLEGPVIQNEPVPFDPTARSAV